MRRYFAVSIVALMALAQQPGPWRPYGPAPVSGGAGSLTGGVTLPIPESDVTGLVSDLAGRPTKGTGYQPSRAAVIDITGNVSAAVGNLSDCVHVDGSSGACGGGTGGTYSGPTFHDAETPSGTLNGSNAAFTLAAAPNPAASLILVRNGVVMRQGGDYTISGASVTFVSGAIPNSGDILQCWYRQ